VAVKGSCVQKAIAKRITESTEKRREHGGMGACFLLRRVEGGEGGDDLPGFEGGGDDLADEVEDVFGIVGTVGVVDDAGAGALPNAVAARVEELTPGVKTPVCRIA